MPLNDLKDVYLAEMRDLYSACTQSRRVTEKLAEAASDPELKDALKAGVSGIEEGSRELERLITKHGETPTGEHCRGMEGLVREAEAHALDEEFGGDAARDAMIISQYQRMTHYAIAGYGCVAAFAKRLGLDEDASTLKNCLDQTRGGDEHMSRIAESGVNAAAA